MQYIVINFYVININYVCDMRYFKYYLFTLFKLPAVWIMGVRVSFLDVSCCKVHVRHRWINQNPYKSMFWAVQGMAAELSTGILLTKKIEDSGKRISMLVTHNKASFTKKARGKIVFTCQQGSEIDAVLSTAIASGEGQTIWMHSQGVDESGDVVSSFSFEWSIKVKN